MEAINSLTKWGNRSRWGWKSVTPLRQRCNPIYSGFPFSHELVTVEIYHEELGEILIKNYRISVANYAKIRIRLRHHRHFAHVLNMYRFGYHIYIPVIKLLKSKFFEPLLYRVLLF